MSVLKKVYHPLLFQGRLDRTSYFEGWYFRMVTADGTRNMALIPGISLTKSDRHAFIQYIDSGNHRSGYFRFPLEAFSWQDHPFSVWVGENRFGLEGLNISLHGNEGEIIGSLRFLDLISYPVKLFSPGIMGWYSFVPAMECYHGIGSIFHQVNGILSINQESVDFEKGTGYIEKDWGVSFPETWLWIQCNTFREARASLMISIARIPWRGSFFMGFISFLWTGNRLYRFATWNRSEIIALNKKENEISVCLQNRKFVLSARVLCQDLASLTAPHLGKMNRNIRESINSEVEVSLQDKSGQTIRTLHGFPSGLELEEDIFGWFDLSE